MLTRLILHNFVIAEQVEISFADGFCALTGETGAGKSLLVGALALLAGGRAAANMVRPPAQTAEVQAVFDISSNPAARDYLKANDLAGDDDEDGDLLLRRVIGSGGKKSTVYINGRQTPLAQLSELMSHLIDICGQHAHYSLLGSNAQRVLLDTYAGADVAAVAAAHRDWRNAEQAHEEALAAAQHAAQNRTLLTQELEELNALDFSADKWQEMNDTLNRTAHVGDLAEGCANITALLRGADGMDSGGAQALLAQVRRQLNDLGRHEPRLAEQLPLVDDADSLLDEVGRAVTNLAENLSTDPEALAAADSFVAECHRLARKYTVADAARLGEFIADKQAALDALPDDAAVDALAKAAAAARKKLDALCKTLSKQREKAAKALCGEVNDLLRQLAMAKATLSVAFTPQQPPTAHGAEKVALQIVTRKGMPPADIGEVASGGELSRLGLAIQLASGKARACPVSVFDEVDAGIGGAAAGVVGGLLRRLGETRQVLCVTHLPQVAAQAHHHWCVDSGDTLQVRELQRKARIEEIARMHSGEVITPAARRHAEELLGV